MRRFLLATVAACALAFSAPAQPPGPPSFKNLKILKPEEVRPVMGSFVMGTGMKCLDCHVQGAYDSDDKPQKVTARKMLEMVRGINANTFNGENKVTCYTCHRGDEHPLTAPPKQ